MRYNTVLFDADGTLLDFLLGEKEALSETMELFGITPTDERVRVYSEINDGLWKMLERGEIKREVLLYRRFEIFCGKYGFDVDFKEMGAEYRRRLATKGQMIEGAEELLDKLFGKTRLFIVTNGVESTQTNRFSCTCIPKYAEKIFISECVGCDKPDIRYFEYVADNIEGFEKSSTIIVGDSLSSDIKGGIGFGIDTCWYNPDKKEKPAELDITYVVDNFDDIYKIITGEEKQ